MNKVGFPCVSPTYMQSPMKWNVRKLISRFLMKKIKIKKKALSELKNKPTTKQKTKTPLPPKKL